MKEEGKKPKDTAILKTDSDRAAFQAFMAFKGTLAQAHLAAFTKYAAWHSRELSCLTGAWVLPHSPSVPKASVRLFSVPLEPYPHS